MNHSQIAYVITEYCVKPFGKHAVIDYDIAELARDIERFSLLYRVEAALALAQGIAESHFACAPAATRSRATKNIFNVGNVDDGSNKYFDSYKAGVERYFDLMNREYRWPEDYAAMLTMQTLAAHDFHRPQGGRYASAPSYTCVVFSIYKKILADPALPPAAIQKTTREEPSA
ncbi:MAG TPA: glucosaminidase domain-containing protein [Candidatus Cloacimonadota bacterium]|nr:glucosaminidase domain-containing protein [Candidatus Cloacimonadota bacterium]HOR58623.1 glucosaminidase domain-containing protein [Candidatus Cloacimonadota bacterium]HRS50780.1 glucosaminidase domain-containing protein [Candidatus Cloacimonadota bacterium]